MKKNVSKIIKRVAAVSVTVLTMTVLAVGDYYVYKYEGELTSWLSPSTTLYDSSNMTETLNASKTVAEQIGDEGITMLKNDGALPLDLKQESERRVNLFGIGGTDVDINGFYSFGAGSGSITAAKQSIIYPRQALTDAGFEVNENLYEFFAGRDINPKEDWWSSSSASNTLNYARAWSDVAVIFISRLSGENINDAEQGNDLCTNSYRFPWDVAYSDRDRDGRNFCQLSLREEAMIDWCSDNFKKIVVVLNSGNSLEPGMLATNKVNAVLYCPYTGQYGATGIGNILSGKTNPSGHLTDTFVYDSTKDPTWANAFVNSSAGKQIHYAEDIYVGYKWYETADHEGYFTKTGTSYDKVVWHPFGYGLSYTDFEWDVESVLKEANGAQTLMRANETFDSKDTTVQVRVKVTNTGSVAGKDVVQLYSSAPYIQGGIEKSYVALAAFAKTDMLYPVSQADDDHPNSQTLTLEFDLYDIASYDSYDKNENGKAVWELDGGQYTLSLRTDAHTLDDCTGAEFTFHIPAAGMAWDVDPVSGGTVENRFTGDKAEADTPIDGSRAGNTPVVYLSRADFEGTFPKTQTPARSVGYDLAKSGTNYIDDKVYFPEAKMPTFDSKETDHMLYTLEDGSKAAVSDLNRSSGKVLVPNEELVMKLGKNYDAHEWDELLDQCSPTELKDLVARCGGASRVAESIGKPLLTGVDGPQGINSYTFSAQPVNDVTGFPAELMVGMTWNSELARQEGAAMACELSRHGSTFVFAPAVDLHRHCYNGRNYEQFSEDPLICGLMGAKIAYGIMMQGVSCSVKHFALSQPGFNARDYNTWLTEQNLRENYVRPFEICVKKTGINFIMTSFANVGGVRCAYSHALCVELLRDEWGFRGAVTTDAYVESTTRTTASLVRAGNDMRFSGSEANRGELDESNAVDMYLTRQSAKNVLYMFCNTYYRAKTYDPNYTVTNVTIVPGTNWWVPTVIVLEVLALAACGYFLFIAFRRKKKK